MDIFGLITKISPRTYLLHLSSGDRYTETAMRDIYAKFPPGFVPMTVATAVSRPDCMANRGRENEGLPKGLMHPACLINCSSEAPSCLEASIQNCASLSKKDRHGRAAGQLVGTSWPNYTHRIALVGPCMDGRWERP